MPGLVVLRPADANEVREAWKVAISRKNGPTLLALSRQAAPTLDRSIYRKAEGLQKGAYILADLGKSKPQLILMSSGTEVDLIIKAGMRLAEEGISVRLVSFPSWELFTSQDKTYQEQVFPPEIKARIAVEAGVSQGWERWIGDQGRFIGMNSYGASAPASVLYEKFGLTVENILRNAREML